MEINKRYRFREVPSERGHVINTIAGKEFIVTGLGHKNVHYQILDESRIRTLPKMFWDVYVEGEAAEVIQGDSKLVFKFIK